ncbi:DUF2892 domain-containing protein [Terriglobus sp. RCC_193]|uniref:YgaP family membrane protein n=1 Tax=Terriglobus sp. RCC_193 TaxID=3239218 RepID=UPI003523B68B
MDDVNVGALDMFVRFLIGMALFSLATLLKGDWRWLALLGFVPLLTAAFRYCPFYDLIGCTTCEEARRLRRETRIAH